MKELPDRSCKSKGKILESQTREQASTGELTAMADTDVNKDSTVLKAIQSMECRIDERFRKLEERLEGMERSLKNLEDNLSEKITEIVAEQMDNMKQSLQGEIADIRDRVTTLESADSGSLPKHDCNIVLTNLAVKDNEQTLERQVSDILKTGLNLENVVVTAAERKDSRREGVPGVVIATLESKIQRSSVLKNKSKLKDHNELQSVHIYPDRPWHERRNDQNLRTIMNTLGNGTLEWKNGRIIQKNEQQNNANFRGQRNNRGHRGGGTSRGGPSRGNSNQGGTGRGVAGRGGQGRGPH